MKFKKNFYKIFGTLFNRMTITLAAFIVQLVYLFMLIYKFSDYAAWMNTGFKVVTIIVILYIIWRDSNPAYKIGWIILMALFPQIGVVLFLIFGGKRPSAPLRKKMEVQELLHYEDLMQVEDLDLIEDRRLRRTVEYIANEGPYPAWGNTESVFYSVGEDMFRDMLEDMKKAEHFIFLEYFIVAKGSLWNEFRDILVEKAEAGLDVRLIYDDIGSMLKIPRHFVEDLEGHGVKVMAFNTMKPFLSVVYNNRDHRKLTIIDGHTGYNGGVNISDEYANRVVRFGHWKDSGVRLHGDAVWNYTVMFLNMWNSFIRTDESYQEFRPEIYEEDVEFAGDGVIQPFGDTPLDDETLSINVYLEIVNQARDYVYIYTPYLILDNEMESALKLAAKRGVDVRIVTPGIPDKRIVYAISRSYYRNLMESGVKIYEYTPGFIHSKCFLSDDKVAVVGTINLDFRSLFLHFECGTLFVENKKINRQLKKDCMQTFRRSNCIDEEELNSHPIGAFCGFFLRIFTPLL